MVEYLGERARFGVGGGREVVGGGAGVGDPVGESQGRRDPQ
ncbi:MAG TPA: hypothetical protein VEO01_09770 [Pseudonocardiaceae bacterium]|nr:hypothetical protein [Pseudonocardiaceae bacterium]